MKKSGNIYAVILAGGSGTRFWPLGRKNCPKQFLSILGRRSLLQDTVERVRPLVSPQRILCVTNEQYRGLIQKQLAGIRIPPGNILLEPEGKNTAPAICWAAAHIARQDPQAVMMVLPADHLIARPNIFLAKMKQALALARAGHLVTMGIVPTRPETGYGYLQTRMVRHDGRQVCRVEKFTEKPTLARAKGFLRRRKYFWNSGMFIWECRTILDAFKKHLPGVHRVFSVGTGTTYVRSQWSRMPKISVDYAILEKADGVVAVPAGGMGWSDLGSWESVWESGQRDSRGNLTRGEVINLGGEGNVLWAGSKLVAAVGLRDVVVIDTPDALLVCRRDRSQEVRGIVENLTKTGKKAFL